MKRFALILATVPTLLITGIVLAQTGSPSPRSKPVQARAHDPLASDAAMRWRQCQPHHWRACLLQQQ